MARIPITNLCKIETKMLFDQTTSYGPYAINTWYFSWNFVSSFDACRDAARDAIEVFYNDNTYGDAMYNWLAQDTSNVFEITAYDMSLTHLIGVPMDPISVTSPGPVGSLPFQDAACLSTVAPPNPAYKRQSLYNRKYLGPLNTSVLSSGFLRSEFVDSALGGWRALVENLDEIGFDTAHPVVVSAKNGIFFDVDYAFVDNSVDIQRRRKLDPTGRQRWPEA